MPSTGFALAKKQALFIYDVVNGMALLRLDTQEIKIPLHLAQNPFRTLSEKTWRGGLHPIETDEIFKRKANDDSKIDLSLLSSQANEIVTTIISITTMPSSTLDSTTILKRNESTSAMQDAWDLALDFTREVAVEPIIPALKLTQRLKNLMEDSMSITKKYCFQLTRVYACILTITFISSKESSRAEGRQLDTLQREMEACLQDANLKNYACKFKGESEEILKVTGDKEVIDALADMLVRQGLSIRWAEANKYSAFFKAEKALKGEDISTLTCPMQ
jgi:hypothetical protein